MPFPIYGSPKPQFFDSSGNLLISGTVAILDPADDTNKASYPTYDDAVALTNANDNPLTLDARGEPSSGLWGLDGNSYKLVLKDSSGNTLYTVDDIRLPEENAYFPQTTAESNAGITPTDYMYQPGDVRRYGAAIDGVTDDFQAFTDALSTGHPVTIPEGTMVINSIVSVSSSTKITGAGKGKTIINGTAISTTTEGVIAVKGTLTQREDPSANISQFDTSITFSSAPTFSDNQVGLIWNPTDSSYSTFRANYYEGEFFHVQDVDAQLDLLHQLYSDYTAADVDIYSLDGVEANISDLTVLAPDNITAAIFLQHCVHSSIQNVEARDGTNASIEIDKCFDVSISDSSVVGRNDTDHGLDYAIGIFNSQNIRISNCYCAARRHAITIGGDSNTGAVVNRDIQITNCVLYAFTDDGAADMHGNSEFVTYSNCQINGGIRTWGGNKNNLIGCKVYGDTSTAVFAWSEVTGLDHLISSNYFESNGGNSSDRAWGMDIGGGDANVIDSDTAAGGIIKVHGNTFINKNSTATSNFAVRCINRGATVEINLEFCDNSIQSADTTSGIIEFDQVTGNEWNNLVICDNRLDLCRIEIKSCTYAYVIDNKIYEGTDLANSDGISVAISVNNGVAHVHRNVVMNSTDDGIFVSGSAVTGETAYISDNIESGSGGTYGVRATEIATVYMRNNTSGNTIRIDNATDAFAFGNTGPIDTSVVTNFTEIGIDSAANLIMPSLPTSTPGGSDRVWNNSNVLNIT